MKNIYIQMRNKKTVDWQFIYDYAVSKGYTAGVESFNLSANYLMMIMSDILDHIDREYELVLLFDKNNNFIKVITPCYTPLTA